jgi:NADH-quinone oxidoreductase subunit J
MLAGFLFGFLFVAFAVFSLAGAIGLVLFRHPMNGAMSFVVTLLSLAGLYALLSAKLIFAVQIIVYAGAIMSLILFIIMFLNVRKDDLPEEPYRGRFLLGSAVVFAPVVLFLLKIIDYVPDVDMNVLTGFGGVKEVGMVLFADWLLPFEMVSILLLVALIGGVMLARKERIK